MNYSKTDDTLDQASEYHRLAIFPILKPGLVVDLNCKFDGQKDFYADSNLPREIIFYST